MNARTSRIPGLLVGLALLAPTFPACSDDGGDEGGGKVSDTRYEGVAMPDVDDPFVLQVDGDTIAMNGTITSNVESMFKQALADHPGIKTLQMGNVGGSADDDANLLAARVVRKAGLVTHLPKDGDIASGGTDLFLAGKTRTIVEGGKIGVHSWAGDVDGKATEGRLLPKDHAEHDKYLDYYKEMGIDEAFYWFTLEAAVADKMHTMTKAEIELYKVATFVAE